MRATQSGNVRGDVAFRLDDRPHVTMHYMIRHCVFVRFRTNVSAGERDEIFDEIVGLRGHLSGIVAVCTGANVSAEVGMDQGFADGFIIDFIDPMARDDYLADAEHQRVGARIVAAAEGGIAGVFVFDLDIA